MAPSSASSVRFSSRRGVVTADKLEALYAVQRERGADLLDLIVERQCGRRDGARAGARRRGAAAAWSSGSIPPRSSPRVATRVPITFAKAHRILVVREDEQAVHVVCGDPFDTQALDDLRVIFGKPVEAVRRRPRSHRGRDQPRLRAAGGRGAARERRRRTTTRRPRATSSTRTTRRRSSAGSTRSFSRR